MSEQPVERPTQPLCVGCGMCCDGTLYARARVSPGEEPRIAAAGLELIEEPDKTFFRLPCQYFGCGQCTIYEDRFDICRSFTCALYRREAANELTPESARSIVDKALELRGKVTSVFPEARVYGNRQALRARLAEQLSGEIGAQRQATAQSLLDIIALDQFLERWFRNPRKADQETGAAAEPENS